MDSAEDRYEILQRRIRKVSKRLSHIIQLNETIKIVVYSDVLSDQIPYSYAGHAFHAFKLSLFRDQTQLLCTLWDRQGGKNDRMSFPSIMRSINDEVLLLAEDYAEKQSDNRSARYLFLSGESIQEGINFINNDNALFSKNARDSVRTTYHLAQEKISIIEKGDLVGSLREFRIHFIAHYLDQETTGTLSKKHLSTINEFSQNGALIDTSLECCNLLNHCLCKTTSNWKDERETAKLYAGDLWNNCTFNIPTS